MNEVSKKVILALLCAGLIAAIYFVASRPKQPVDSPGSSVPATSLEKEICEKLSAQNDSCKRFFLYDPDTRFVFVENSSGILPAFTNKEFTAFTKFIYPELNFQEFKEEASDRGPIIWQVNNKVQKNVSLIYGFATSEAKTIIINSEGNRQPHRVFVRDNLWAWYMVTSNKVKLPVKATVYDENGKVISE